MFFTPAVGWITKPATATYLSNNYNSASASSHTWTGVTLGTAYPYFVVGTGYISGDGSNRTFSSLTVAGSAATSLANSHAASTGVALWIVPLSAASGNIVLTLSGTSVGGMWYGLWGIKDLISSTPLSTDSKNDASADIRVAVTTSTTSSSGLVFGSSTIWNETTTDTWTGGLGNIIDFHTNASTTPGGNGVSGAGTGSSMTINSPLPGSSSATNTAVAAALR